MRILELKEGFSEFGLSKLETQENPMQVFGLPGHLIRNAGQASRLLGAETQRSKREKTRCSGALATRHGYRTECQRRGCCGRRGAFDPLRWKAAAAEEPASASTARQRLVTCAALCGRAAGVRLPHVGKDNSARSCARPAWPSPTPRSGASSKAWSSRPGDTGSPADSQTSAQSHAQKPAPCHPQAEGRLLRKPATSSRSIR